MQAIFAPKVLSYFLVSCFYRQVREKNDPSLVCGLFHPGSYHVYIRGRVFKTANLRFFLSKKQMGHDYKGENCCSGVSIYVNHAKNDVKNEDIIYFDSHSD
jgi:hypothetical protein